MLIVISLTQKMIFFLGFFWDLQKKMWVKHSGNSNKTIKPKFLNSSFNTYVCYYLVDLSKLPCY